jgi:hypothetical protein
MPDNKISINAATSTIEEYVNFTIAEYQKALDNFSDMDPEERAKEAADAWRCILPILDTPDAAKAFIACVAVGHQRHWIDAHDCRAMMYTAQLALAAMNSHRARRR